MPGVYVAPERFDDPTSPFLKMATQHGGRCPIPHQINAACAIWMALLSQVITLGKAEHHGAHDA
ncbi:MAG: hypothetical protein QW520_06935 [Methanomassiliicoccales archaeon]